MTSDVLRERLTATVHDWLALESPGPAMAHQVDTLVDSLLPVIETEVSARISEAEVAVPEPLVVGEIHAFTADRRSYMVRNERGFIDPEAVGRRVGIWPADLGDRVCDHALDKEGWREENEALRAVARRLREWSPMERGDGSLAWCKRNVTPPPWEQVTDAERRALDSLEER